MLLLLEHRAQMTGRGKIKQRGNIAHALIRMRQELLDDLELFAANIAHHGESGIAFK